MKISLLAPIFILICFCCSIVFALEDQNNKLELNNLIPQRGEVGGWLPDGKANYASGEDLFLLINGGSEIYHEYGFKRTVFQTYATKDGKSINLEIYEMNNQEAAYGIYSFKTGSDGRLIELGYEGWFESYYLNFWEGNFLVTVIGLDTDRETLDGVIKIAKAVDSKLTFPSKQPHINSYLPKENLQANGITYLKGNIGLFNQYEFDNKNVFGLKEGVIGKYGDYSIFLLQYGNQRESMEWHESAKNHLKQSKRFNNFISKDTHFEISDRQNSRLSIKQYQNWILIILGNDKTDTKQIYNLLEAKLTQ